MFGYIKLLLTRHSKEIQPCFLKVCMLCVFGNVKTLKGFVGDEFIEFDAYKLIYKP